MNFAEERYSTHAVVEDNEEQESNNEVSYSKGAVMAIPQNNHSITEEDCCIRLKDNLLAANIENQHPTQVTIINYTPAAPGTTLGKKALKRLTNKLKTKKR